MSAADLVNTCPACGAEEGLDVLLNRMIADDEARLLIAEVIATSLPLGTLVLRYLRLHKPAKQRLRLATVRKLLAELVPDLQRLAIERNGRVWALSTDSWKLALQAVFDNADRGTLTLPLEGNGYLYSVLARMADRTEGAAEQAREDERRAAAARPKDTVTVRGQTMTIGAGLDAVFAGKDPALAKIESDRERSVPMPADVRERLHALRGKGGAA